MLHKHTLITAALLATLGLTACNKDKTVGGPPPTQTESTGQVEDLPDLGGAGTNVNPSAPVGKTNAQSSGPDYEINKDGVIMGKQYGNNNPANVDSNAYGKRLTGGVSQEGLLYTSSSPDDTLDVLRGLKRDQLGLSASVTEAKLKFESISGLSVVTLNIQENGFARVYNLVGDSAFEDGNEIVRLRSARTGNGTKTTGSMPIRGTLQCLDLDGKCETTLVKVELGWSGSASHIDIVFRQSNADLFFKMSPGSGNPEYDFIKDMAVNTFEKKSGTNRVQSSKMSSWEVVNGRAGFTVVLKTFENQMLAFSGPLVSPQSGNSTNVTLKRLAKDPNEDDDIGRQANLTYQNMIGEARLTANNGLGQIRLVFKMRKYGTYKQDVFAITFMRRSKPVIDLNDYQDQQDQGNDNGNQNPGGGYEDGGSDDLPSVE
ncbi:hypothetical protein DOM22_18940 [Bdellovibrio sp. ZAP7]|uniref:hypothetical protein n=1 Tax=Bdellovibrio sp. ZAP7 TaxID=2231053 RepID=UPI001158A520|nr:hypothetical protein [Bdellovibrio sp. ZAP7]QDK47090.1 hypothetical protein DOM22_18940 [Bdellovibrio sp. ZAP7]